MLVFSPWKVLWVVLSRQESISSECSGSCLTEGKGGKYPKTYFTGGACVTSDSWLSVYTPVQYKTLIGG